MWVVKLMKKPTVHNYREGYFPRRFRYKKAAQELVYEVMCKGGRAVMEDEKRAKAMRAPVFGKGYNG
jgi:hypothetical protein